MAPNPNRNRRPNGRATAKEINKGVAKDVPLRVIFTGVIPFLVASVAAIILIMILPEIALYIPTQVR